MLPHRLPLPVILLAAFGFDGIPDDEDDSDSGGSRSSVILLTAERGGRRVLLPAAAHRRELHRSPGKMGRRGDVRRGDKKKVASRCYYFPVLSLDRSSSTSDPAAAIPILQLEPESGKSFHRRMPVVLAKSSRPFPFLTASQPSHICLATL